MFAWGAISIRAVYQTLEFLGGRPNPIPKEPMLLWSFSRREIISTSKSNIAIQRRLAAILAADVVGYSRLMAADEEGTLTRLRSARSEFIDPTIAQHHGRIVKLMGDGVLVEFASVVDAVRCAIELQKGMAKRELAILHDARLRFRIGINLGDIIIEDHDIYGDGVNVAARIEGIAETGGIAISGTAFDHVKGKIDAGFQFVGERSVKNIPDPVRVYTVMPEAPAGSMEDLARRKSWRLSRSGIAAAFVVIIAAVWGWLGLSPDTVALDPNRVAVMPFNNLSPNQVDEYFADGLTEELSNQLAKIPEIAVIARSSVRQYAEAHDGLEVIGRELGVGTVLEGSVRKQSDAVRIVARLINVASQTQHWSQDYNRELSDIFDVQEDIAVQVANALEIALLAKTRTRLGDLGTDDPQAYELYLQGLQAVRFRTKESVEGARQLFEAALARDPDFPQALAGLAEYYGQLREVTDITTDEANQRVLELAGRAVELDANLAEACISIALVHLYEHKWNEARRSFEQALRANPSLARAHNQYGHKLLLVVESRNDEALAELRRTIALDPLSRVARVNLGFALYHLERHEDAAAHFRTMLETDPNYLFAHVGLGQSFIWLGEVEEGLAQMEHAADLVDRPAWIMGFVGWAYARAGREEEARTILADLENRRAAGKARALPLARIYMALGDLDAAFSLLNEAYQANDPNLIYLRMPEFHRELAPDSRYYQLVDRMGLKPPFTG